MTQWGIDTLFNPGKRHMDEEKRRLQSTREEIGDSSGGRRIDLESGKVRLTGQPGKDETAEDGAGKAETVRDETQQDATARDETQQDETAAGETAAGEAGNAQPDESAAVQVVADEDDSPAARARRRRRAAAAG